MSCLGVLGEGRDWSIPMVDIRTGLVEVLDLHLREWMVSGRGLRRIIGWRDSSEEAEMVRAPESRTWDPRERGRGLGATITQGIDGATTLVVWMRWPTQESHLDDAHRFSS